jgi:hypothetical protein
MENQIDSRAWEKETNFEGPFKEGDEEPTYSICTDTSLPGEEDEERREQIMSASQLCTCGWQNQQPDCAHLRAGTALHAGTCIPLFDVGDRIVVESYTSLLPGEPWLETVVGTVLEIDDDSGVVKLSEEPHAGWRKRHFGYRKQPADRFYLAPASGSPFGCAARRRVAVGCDATEVNEKSGTDCIAEATAAGTNIKQNEKRPEDGINKKKRGRPKGSKNKQR